MLFSKSVEYALRAVAWLAAHAESSDDPRRPIPAPATQIAAATQIPSRFLSDILQSLARGGVVDSQRGPKGGFILSRPADQVYVLDIVRIIDPIHRVGSCPLTGAAHHDQLCPLHQMLDDALAQIETVFAHTRLADLTCLELGIKPPDGCTTASDAATPPRRGRSSRVSARHGGRGR